MDTEKAKLIRLRRATEEKMPEELLQEVLLTRKELTEAFDFTSAPRTELTITQRLKPVLKFIIEPVGRLGIYTMFKVRCSKKIRWDKLNSVWKIQHRQRLSGTEQGKYIT